MQGGARGDLDKSRGDALRRERDESAVNAPAVGGAAGAMVAKAAKLNAADSSGEAAPGTEIGPKKQSAQADHRVESATATAPTPQPSADAVSDGTAFQNVESTAAPTASQSEMKVAAAARAAGRPQVSAAVTKYITVVTPDGTVSWRIGQRGRIERSTTSGTSWKQQNSGTSQDLLAGAASSDLACWVVGRAGTILRTVDGGHWEKVAAPISADLDSVNADDALNATISSGSRQFATADGGVTWRSNRD